MDRPDLPDYHRPPIDEVVIGLQFDALAGFSDAHAGLLWQRMRTTYPQIQSQPRLEIPVETLPERQYVHTAQFVFGAAGGASQTGRTFLVSSDDSLLLQVQDTAFLHNWRKRNSGYPHLETVWGNFWDGFVTFSEMLNQEGIDAPRPRQLEVSYFNWVPGTPVGWFLRLFESTRTNVPGLQELPQDVAFASAFLDFEGDAPIARLVVECAPAIRVPSDGGERATGSRFVLSYKAPFRDEPDEDRLNHLIRRAREVIVRAFTDLTTPEAHEIWQRFQ